MSQEINADELEAKRMAQERVTKPLHSEDVPLFLGESVELKKDEDEQDANRE